MALAKSAIATVAPPVFLIGLLLLVAWFVGFLVDGSNGSYWDGVRDTNGLSLLICLVVSGSLLLMAISLVDVNLFSLNAMYANRLIRCYLAQRDGSGPGGGVGGWGWKLGPQNGRGTTGIVDPLARSENLITGFDLSDDIPLYHLLQPRRDGTDALHGTVSLDRYGAEPRRRPRAGLAGPQGRLFCALTDVLWEPMHGLPEFPTPEKIRSGPYPRPGGRHFWGGGRPKHGPRPDAAADDADDRLRCVRVAGFRTPAGSGRGSRQGSAGGC